MTIMIAVTAKLIVIKRKKKNDNNDSSNCKVSHICTLKVKRKM